MKTILVPVDKSANTRHALEHVARLSRQGTPLDVKLLNVQPRMNRHVAQFVPRAQREGYRQEAGGQALDAASRILAAAGVSHSCYLRVGDRAETIAEFARAQRCDQIILVAPRGGWLAGLGESALAGRVAQLAEVPVEVLAGAKPSGYERIGVPAGLGMGLALILLAAE